MSEATGHVMGEALGIAVGDYDRTRQLLNGAVPVAGFRANFAAGDLEEIFAQAFSTAPVAVSR